MTLTPYTCDETFRRLDDYLDRELSAEETRLVAEHLERCAQCAREFALEREVLDQIRTKLQRIRAPSGLLARISATLDRP
jgi:mycothiol system anti-sigma-R factor